MAEQPSSLEAGVGDSPSEDPFGLRFDCDLTFCLELCMSECTLAKHNHVLCRPCAMMNQLKKPSATHTPYLSGQLQSAVLVDVSKSPRPSLRKFCTMRLEK